MHPVEHDLRRPVPPCRHVTCHLVVRLSGQPKVEDLCGQVPGLWDSGVYRFITLNIDKQKIAHPQLAVLIHSHVTRLQVLRETLQQQKSMIRDEAVSAARGMDGNVKHHKAPSLCLRFTEIGSHKELRVQTMSQMSHSRSWFTSLTAQPNSSPIFWQTSSISGQILNIHSCWISIWNNCVGWGAIKSLF